MTYAAFEQDSAPPWLQGRWGRAWFEVSGLLKDAWVDAAKGAVKARFRASAPRDALRLLLRDYALDEAGSEPEATTRSRLARAWEMWSLAGTRRGLAVALGTIGYGQVLIKEFDDWNVTRRPWDFWVVLRRPFPWDPALVSLVRWGRVWRIGDATHLSGGVPDGERERVLALVERWKPAHAHCVHVGVLLRGALWGDDGARFGDGLTFGGDMAIWRS